MAERKPALTVALSVAARVELVEIWNYNAEHRSLRQADRYQTILLENVEALSLNYFKGKRIEEFPELNYVSVKNRTGADGHILVYEVQPDRGLVVVLHIFHSKMDVLSRLQEDRS